MLLFGLICHAVLSLGENFWPKDSDAACLNLESYFTLTPKDMKIYVRFG